MEIRVGDRVVTNLGQCGVVDMICNCEECKKRGFDEPQIKFEDGSYGYITDYDASHGFTEYYQIGDNIWPKHVSINDLASHIDDQRSIADGAISKIYDAAKLLDAVSMK